MEINYPDLTEIGRVDPIPLERSVAVELLSKLSAGTVDNPTAILKMVPQADGWIAPLPDQGRMPERVSAGDLFFPSPEIDQSYEALGDLQGERGLTVRLHNDTGLPSSFYGDLLDLDVGSSAEEKVELFFQKYTLAVTGRSNGVQLYRIRQSLWDDQTEQLLYQQTNRKGIPLYSAYVACTFDTTKRFILLTSSLYPAIVEELPDFPDTTLTPEAAKEILYNQLPEAIGFRDFPYLTDKNQDSIFTRCIFPYHQNDAVRSARSAWKRSEPYWQFYHDGETAVERGIYRPTFRVSFQDQFTNDWLAFIDAEEHKILHLELHQAQAIVNYNVYVDTQSALNVTLQSEPLNLGDNATTLRTSTSVKLNGNRLYDPNDPAEQPIEVMDPKLVLGANVFFHVQNSRFLLHGMLAAINEKEPVNTKLANPLLAISAYVESGGGSAVCKFETCDIHFSEGNIHGVFPIAEPAFDAEVIAHEFSHATMHYFYPHLFERTFVGARLTVSRALDEALAFYFAAWMFRDSQWAEFAYESWQAVRELNNPPEPFSMLNANNDPAGLDYGWALWWARILWQLSQKDLLASSFNRILLKSLRAMAGTLPEVKASDSLREQIKSTFVWMGSMLYATANNREQQLLIQKFLQNYEIFVQ